ncbi:MAG: endonuclease [Gammaproteobacteria bacterium]|nr:endonuclease [Gammaproteobacteria bacterium]
MLVAAGATAEQARLENYFEAIPIFWQEVYPDGGETLYCGEHFGARKDRSFNIEHVYPMAWAMKAEGCRERNQCRHSSKRFNRMESDMHNFYPSRKDINRTRGSFPFGMVRGEPRLHGNCDFEFDPRTRTVEPRPQVRGNIARAMFYMQETYGLNIYRRQGEMLRRWSREDPPDDEERRRNDAIEQIQGNRNRFIDNPKAVEQLRF